MAQPVPMSRAVLPVTGDRRAYSHFSAQQRSGANPAAPADNAAPQAAAIPPSVTVNGVHPPLAPFAATAAGPALVHNSAPAPNTVASAAAVAPRNTPRTAAPRPAATATVSGAVAAAPGAPVTGSLQAASATTGAPTRPAPASATAAAAKPPAAVAGAAVPSAQANMPSAPAPGTVAAAAAAAAAARKRNVPVPVLSVLPTELAKKVPKHWYPYRRREPYPDHVATDFRKMSEPALRAYVDEYAVPVAPDVNGQELAVAVARHFDSQDVPDNEEDVLVDFLHRLRTSQRRSVMANRRTVLDNAGGHAMAAPRASGSVRSRGVDHGSGAGAGGGPSPAKKRRRRVNKPPPIPIGTRVCARVNGNWIMARTTRWSSRSNAFEVVDEDVEEDTGAPGDERPPGAYHKVSQDYVLRLTDPDFTKFSKGERVLALFPQTTSFYAGNVVTAMRNGMVGVRFDDDEEDGRLVRKRPVPATCVIKCPRHVLEEEDEA